MMNDDMQLLREYVERRSESAFETLVGRYVALVHSAALRQVRDPSMAEEITQTVFILLARKAGSLTSKTRLAGWLYRATRYVAAAALKMELRRHRREQEAQMLFTPEETQVDVVWQELSPLLDEAMTHLRDADRDALLLRYFQNKSLRDVGAALGVDEYAAQKRVGRAVEKLRDLFVKRGVVSGTAAIAIALSTHSVQAVPLGLAKSVTSIAVAKGAAVSGSVLPLIQGALKIMAWTKVKTAVAVGAALILVTGTSVVTVQTIRSSAASHERSGDLPRTLPELNAWYVEPPANQNAAVFILDGIAALQVDPGLSITNLPVLGQLPQPGAPLPPQRRAALAAFVQANANALRFFAEASGHEQSRYPIDLNNGLATPLRHLEGVRRAAQVAEVAAILHGAEAKGTEAADDVLMTLALARSLNAEPCYNSQTVRAGAVLYAVDALEQVLNATDLPENSLNELSKTLGNMEREDAEGVWFNRATVGERVTAMESVQLLYKMPAKMLKRELAHIEMTYDEVMAIRHEAFPGRLRVSDVFMRRAAEATKKRLSASAVLLAKLDKVATPEARCLARLRLGQAAVALEQHRRAHDGRYPESLSDLVPAYLAETPIDPFDGAPIRYRKEGVGYVLYSVGPDLADDSGAKLKGKTGDIVFSVVVPKP